MCSARWFESMWGRLNRRCHHTLLQDALSRGYKFEMLPKPVHPLVLFQTLRSFATALS